MIGSPAERMCLLAVLSVINGRIVPLDEDVRLPKLPVHCELPAAARKMNLTDEVEGLSYTS